MELIKLALVEDIPPGTMKAFPAGKIKVLVVNYNGSFYAIDNECTHAGGDLSQGKLDGKIVTCPRHHSQFDLTTGECISGPKILLFHPKIENEKNYPLTIEGNQILVSI